MVWARTRSGGSFRALLGERLRRAQWVAFALGIIQYISPIGRFLIGWPAIGEQMPAGRWAGFAIIWLAVAVFVRGCATAGQRRQSWPAAFP